VHLVSFTIETILCISYSSCSWLKAHILDYPYFSIAHATLFPTISQDNLYSSLNLLPKSPYRPTLTQTDRSAIRSPLSRHRHNVPRKGRMTKQLCFHSRRRQRSGVHLIRQGPNALSLGVVRPGLEDYHLHEAMSFRMR